MFKNVINVYKENLQLDNVQVLQVPVGLQILPDLTVQWVSLGWQENVQVPLELHHEMQDTETHHDTFEYFSSLSSAET